MRELLTAAQMRERERRAIDSGAVTGLELMERAGRGVVAAVFEHWPDLAQGPRKAAVLCGPGNNGGDGFVVARLLRDRGWQVELYLFGKPEKLPPDAKVNHDRWIEGGRVRPYVDSGPNVFAPDDDVVLLFDALFGTGLTRPAKGFGALAQATRAPGRRVVAIDLPSGLCSDSGRCLADATVPDPAHMVRADLTVSFHAEKLGHRLACGPAACGRVVVRDIGLAHAEDRDVVSLVTSPLVPDKTGAHKFDHGHALVLTGGAGRTGAAQLAARGALRIGAGLVTLGVPGAAQQEVAAGITALMLRRVDRADDLAALLGDPRINALCLGPGLGLGPDKAALVGAALDASRATVLDADALTLMGGDAALFARLHEACVLTPHAGEFARLFPDIAGRLAAPPQRGPAFSKVDATRAAARRAGCVLLYKGAGTVIAAPDGRCSLHSAEYERAAPWLATAGAGDVLAGFIAGLLARGMAPMRAAETAAFCHVECARRFGPGLIAEDLPEMLPAVLRDRRP